MDYSREARIRYREVQPARHLQIILWLGVITMGVGLYFTATEPEVPRFAPWVLLLGLIAMFASALVFGRFDILLDDRHLSFGFVWPRPVVDLQDIVSAGPERITLWRYGGIGIRIGARAVCYNTRFGEGVRIRVKGRRRDWVFSCSEPQRLISLLNDDIRKHGSDL